MLQSINYVLLHSKKETNDEIKLGDGTVLIKDTTYEPEKHAIQKLEVLAPPVKWNMDIKKGDFVYVHHFVCMNESDYLWSKKEGIYWCPKDFVYARVRKGKVKMLGHWAFIKPIIEEGPRTKSGIFLTPDAEVEVFQQGTIRYINKELKELGLKVGDRIGFSKNSEYDMEVEGETLYRMRTKDILYKVEE